ncbi:MAG TPA: peptide deformylase, partial [Labilithrix sp.]|nr:peptide deformylase [Labilithrix sp.]
MGEPKYDWMRDDAALAPSEVPVRTRSGTHRRVPVRQVIEHPDPRLSRPSVEVDPRDPRVSAIAEALVATMRVSPACTGLAAPQIGENVRLFAVDVSGHKKARSCAGLVVLANPRVLEHSGNIVMREGCMSVPQFTGDVARARTIVVSGVVPGSGRHIQLEADAMEARCILHE